MQAGPKLVALGQQAAGKLAVVGTRCPLYSRFGGKDLDKLLGKDWCTIHTVKMDYTNCSFEK